MDYLLTVAIERTREITNNIFGEDSLVLKAVATEKENISVLRDEQAGDPLLVQKTIYSRYWKN